MATFIKKKVADFSPSYNKYVGDGVLVMIEVLYMSKISNKTDLTELVFFKCVFYVVAASPTGGHLGKYVHEQKEKSYEIIKNK